MKKVDLGEMESGFYDLLGNNKSNVQEVKLDETANTLIQLAAIYSGLIAEKADKVDASSSGRMQDSIKPTEIEYDGSTYTIGIEAKDYLSYVDSGVNGWAVNRGSVFSFKTKGVDPNGEMVKSLKEYLKNEGNSSRPTGIGKYKITEREKKGMDALTKNAVTVAYMIKRQGIKPKHFLRDATTEMEVVIRNELGAAFKIDIINNFTT